MLRRLENTFCFARTLGVMFTLLSMLFVLSAPGAFEVCSEESVSQEIELVLGRREVRRVAARDSVSRTSDPVPDAARTAKTSQESYFVAVTERSRMNGSGTFLLI